MAALPPILSKLPAAASRDALLAIRAAAARHGATKLGQMSKTFGQVDHKISNFFQHQARSNSYSSMAAQVVGRPNASAAPGARSFTTRSTTPKDVVDALARRYRLQSDV